MVDSQLFKVSVCMTAYNQEAFIRQAIEGVLSQRTDFQLELVISDDCSSDATGDICAEYAWRFPEKIRYIRREKNLGMMANFVVTLDECNGKYIAVCEGDDYWVDNSKLQQQADLMEKHPDVSLCCHGHLTLKDDRKVSSESLDGPNVIFFDGNDYLRRPFSHTASFFFRNALRPHPFPIWYRDLKLAGDHFLVLFLSVNGRIAYINKILSAFRTHAASYSNSVRLLEIKNDYLRNLELFDKYSDGRFTKTINIVKKKWELIYHVYEPKGYLSRLSYLIANFDVLVKHFRLKEALRVSFRYLVPVELTSAMRRSFSQRN